MQRIPIAAFLVALVPGLAGAAEPIAGKWRTENGGTASIADCGGGYCITVETGPYKGKRIGRLNGSGNDYSGEITDPANDKTYAGTAAIAGASLKLTGCALKIFCRSQTWTRQ